jgi:hypothetical protein
MPEKYPMKIKVGEKEITLSIPSYLKMYIPAQLSNYSFQQNSIKGDLCYVCGINYTKMSDTNKVWAELNICKKCSLENPVLLFHITTILSFDMCQQSFWNSHVLGIKLPPSIWLVEGIIGHYFDKFLLDYFSIDENYEKFKKYYPSRTKIQTELLKILREHYDKIIEEVMTQENIPGQLIVTQKEEIFESLLNDYAFLFAKRIYNDMKYEGEFRELQAFKWKEEKVYAYDEFYDVRILQSGKIDKLFKIKENLFVIWDDKTKSTIRHWKSDFSDSSKQLGGYAHCLEQIYGAEVHVLGVLNLLRYFYPTFVYVDKEGYIEVVKRLCDFIRNSRTPMKLPKNSGICKEAYCGYFDRCWKGGVLK